MKTWLKNQLVHPSLKSSARLADFLGIISVGMRVAICFFSKTLQTSLLLALRACMRLTIPVNHRGLVVRQPRERHLMIRTRPL